MASRAADLLWKLWYPLLTRRTLRAPLTFLNYGYAPDRTDAATLVLLPDDEPDRPCIQLYDAVVGPVKLQGQDVLEVSCGHGGGASFIARYHGPRSMLGVDRNARAIEFCNRRHKVAGLRFAQGNAMSLDLPDAIFDAVINVEASHCYPDVPTFFREVARVLRPGGHFLYTDFRLKMPDAAILQKQLEASGLEIVVSEDISQRVVGGMRLNTQKYLALIKQLVPPLLHRPAMRFAGVPGSAIYNELISGKTVYMRYVLRRRLGVISEQTTDDDRTRAQTRR